MRLRHTPLLTLVTVLAIGLFSAESVSQPDKQRAPKHPEAIAAMKLVAKLDKEAVTAVENDDLPLATRKLQEALKRIQKEWPDRHHMGVALYALYLHELYAGMGDIDKAYASAKLARAHLQGKYKETKREGNKDEITGVGASLGACLTMLGHLALTQHKLELAESHLVEALPFCEATSPADRTVLVQCLLVFGSLEMARARFPEARRYIDRAHDIQDLLQRMKRPVSDWERAQAWHLRGRLRGYQRDWQRAIEAFTEAVKAADKVGTVHTVPLICDSLSGLATAFVALEQNDKAANMLELASKALAEDKLLANSQLKANLVLQHGLVSLSQGEYKQAHTHVVNVLKMYEKLPPKGQHPFIATVMCVLAVVEDSLGRPKTADRYLNKCLDMQTGHAKKRGSKHDPEVARTWEVKAALAAGRKRNEDAMEYLEEALRLSQAHVRDFLAFASEAEGLNFGEELVRMRDAYLSLAAATPKRKVKYDLVWSDRGLLLRTLASRQRLLEDLAAKDKMVNYWLREWRGARLQLSGQTLTPLLCRDIKWEERLSELDLSKEVLEQKLTDQLKKAGIRADIGKLSPRDLADRLSPNTVFLDIYRVHRHDSKKAGEFQYVGFVVSNKAEPQMVDFGPAAPIDKALALWRGQIEKGEREDDAATVRKLLWDPLAPFIPSDRKSPPTVYVSSEGPVAGLPWSCIPDRKEIPLVRSCRIASAPNGSFLAERLATKARRFGNPDDRGQMLLVGEVAYDKAPFVAHVVSHTSPPVFEERSLKPWRDLPGSSLELDRIKPLVPHLPGKPSLVERRGQGASVTQIIADLSDARIAHLSTHAFFVGSDRGLGSVFAREQTALTAMGPHRLGVVARNPLAHTAVVLAGANQPTKKDTPTDTGYLAAETIAALNLRRLRLVVLSNCQSGLGQGVAGEGVFSLQRAFHLGGADDVVASLWNLPDDATAALMILFYQILQTTPRPIDALREAQLMFLDNPAVIDILKKDPKVAAKLFEARRAPDAKTELAPAPKDLPSGKEGKRILRTRDWAGLMLSGLGE